MKESTEKEIAREVREAWICREEKKLNIKGQKWIRGNGNGGNKGNLEKRMT